MGIFNFGKKKETVCDTASDNPSSCYPDMWHNVPCRKTTQQVIWGDEVIELAFAPEVREIRTFLCKDMRLLKRVVLPANLEKIGFGAFQNCTALQDIQIPGGVTRIGKHALENLKAMQGKPLYLPKSVAYLEESAFGSSCFPAFVVDADHPYLKMTKDLLLTDGGTTAYRYIGDGSTPCAIPEGITRIGAEAFQGSAIKQIHILASVKEMGTAVFSKCGNLTQVRFADGMNCSEDHILPNHTFQFCKNLIHMTLPANAAGIGTHAFAHCKKLEHIDLPDGIKIIQRAAFNECEQLKTVKIPESVTKIEGCAFFTSGLQKIHIPDGIEVLEEETFWKCSHLKEVTGGKNIRTIKRHAFFKCSELPSFSCSPKLELIEHSAFEECTSLKYKERCGWKITEPSCRNWKKDRSKRESCLESTIATGSREQNWSITARRDISKKNSDFTMISSFWFSWRCCHM